MGDYEKLGLFYLGRRHDPETRQTRADLMLYESKHLVTHGLVVGMTGSGKTGLCFDLIEEATIDGIPTIVIDPKGDLGNLLLTFPELRPADFGPWVNPDDAARRSLSVAEYAVEQATLWRQGLAGWGQDGDRIRRLRAAAEFAIYTPGSRAGLPVSILQSFAPPPASVMEDGEMLRDRVGSTVGGLLGLVGIEADPVRNRESILLAHLLQHAWAGGRALDVATLIQAVQNPPMQRIGVLDLETFYPAKERFELALQLNNLLASPSFASWMEGEPLEVGRLLYTASGQPRVAIFSVAHLGDSERMFFVTLLLNQVVSWMRAQSGTSSLRALVYMDEIHGYFPPVANPPPKLPLLTLLKQARAFGVGVVLATQNPVDLDYKGLANIGTWFIGRLQTERDKARVLEGLEGVAVGRGQAFDRAATERLLAGLPSRVFLLHNVHDEGIDVFESRWAMSYLRGPLSRSQIKELMDPARPVGGGIRASGEQAAATVGVKSEPGSETAAGSVSARPVLPPEVPQFFAPVREAHPPGSTVHYRSRLLGVAQVRFADTRIRVDVQQPIVVVTEITDGAIPVDWAASEELAVAAKDLEKRPGEGDYAPCPPAAGQVKNYAGWSKDFTAWLQSERKLMLWRSPALQEVSRPGEVEGDFRVRLRQAAREARDAGAEKLRQKYAPKLATLEDRVRRAQAAREREEEQAQRAKVNTFISVGSTLLGAFLGRKAVSASNVGRAATSMRSAGRAMDQAADAARAEDTVEALQQRLEELEGEFQTEVNAFEINLDSGSEALEVIELRPTRSDIQVRLVALVWLPFLKDAAGDLRPAY